MGDEEANCPNWTFWRVFTANLQSTWWGIEHWLLTKVLRKEFCKSCSGYFHANTTVAGKCEQCFVNQASRGLETWQPPNAPVTR